jgi:carbamoyl-phosphate synthase large subunit
LAIAKSFGYPVLARPSYVIGGQGMAILANEEELQRYLENFFIQYQDGRVQIDQYIQGKELEVDVISDGKSCLIPAIMTHLEPSGVHSGDSITILPSPFLDQEIIDQAVNASEKLAAGLKAIGFLNIQMIWADKLYVIEANPRASRTLPILSKVTDVPMTEIAIRVMLGEELAEMGYGTGLLEPKLPYAVKVPVFSMEKLPGAEVMLGPEMRSTGEVLGLGATPEEAMRKGMIAAGVPFPKTIRILAMVRDVEKPRLQEIIKGTQGLQVEWTATEGTARLFDAEGITCSKVEKIQQNDELLTEIRQGDYDWVLNLPTKGNDATRDGFLIRRATLESGKTLFTSFETFETAFGQWQLVEAEKRFYPLMKK